MEGVSRSKYIFENPINPRSTICDELSGGFCKFLTILLYCLSYNVIAFNCTEFTSFSQLGHNLIIFLSDEILSTLLHLITLDKF